MLTVGKHVKALDRLNLMQPQTELRMTHTRTEYVSRVLVIMLADRVKTG